jgi:hypothetical protein
VREGESLAGMSPDEVGHSRGSWTSGFIENSFAYLGSLHVGEIILVVLKLLIYYLQTWFLVAGIASMHLGLLKPSTFLLCPGNRFRTSNFSDYKLTDAPQTKYTYLFFVRQPELLPCCLSFSDIPTSWRASSSRRE